MTAAIPDDIMAAAYAAFAEGENDHGARVTHIARALQAERNRATEAERERCAQVASARGYAIAAYAIRQPTGE